jgi:hypothetical protein
MVGMPAGLPFGIMGIIGGVATAALGVADVAASISTGQPTGMPTPNTAALVALVATKGNLDAAKDAALAQDIVFAGAAPVAGLFGNLSKGEIVAGSTESLTNIARTMIQAEHAMAQAMAK